MLSSAVQQCQNLGAVITSTEEDVVEAVRLALFWKGYFPRKSGRILDFHLFFPFLFKPEAKNDKFGLPYPLHLAEILSHEMDLLALLFTGIFTSPESTEPTTTEKEHPRPTAQSNQDDFCHILCFSAWSYVYSVASRGSFFCC